MAGGAASRFGRKVEKGVLRVGDRTLLERAVDALSACGIDSVAVAVTEKTPQTEALARSIGIPVARTSGRGYHEDTLELIRLFGRYVSLNVDVPFITREHVEALISRTSTGSAAAVVPAELSYVMPEQGSVMMGPDGRMMVWVGLNIVSDDPDTNLVVLEDGLLCINVNDDESLRLADDTSRERVL